MSVDEIRRQLPNFFRCPLPDCCLDFCSPKGKLLFKESLNEGDANIYFKLAAHFHTQSEPQWSCGVSALAMVLNALEIDPCIVWKHYWRYFDETIVKTGKSIEEIKKDGINLLELSEIANENRAHSKARICEENEESLSIFRREIQESARSEDTAMIVSYWRNVVGQMGDGHFCPIGAYHEATDSVLLMEVSRYKYGPHWVKIIDLHRAMCVFDESMNRNRGYLLIKPIISTEGPKIRLQTANCCENRETISSITSWTQFLKSKKSPNETEENTKILANLSEIFPKTQCFYDETKDLLDLNNNEDDGRNDFRIHAENFEDFEKLDIFHCLIVLAWPYVKNYSDRSERLRLLAEKWRKSAKISSHSQIESFQQQIIVFLECARLR
ncbi:unnamed protein product, partial [Mesorhabditis belari]|uniref:glutathione gamma-glutamylcysteinyltransferase n=1 Tax=Mesorhabditis belari TaxID=2138241 RepID=A0AAF3J624_9BILA